MSGLTTVSAGALGVCSRGSLNGFALAWIEGCMLLHARRTSVQRLNTCRTVLYIFKMLVRLPGAAGNYSRCVFKPAKGFRR